MLGRERERGGEKREEREKPEGGKMREEKRGNLIFSQAATTTPTTLAQGTFQVATTTHGVETPPEKEGGSGRI